MSDLNSQEQRLVHPSSNLWSGCLVGSLRIGDVAECGIEVFGDGLDLDVRSGRQSLGFSEFPSDAVLFVFELVQRDGSGVVSLEQLVSLADEAGNSPALPLGLFGGFVLALAEQIEDEGPQFVSLLAGELVLAVFGDDLLLGNLDEHNALGAAGPLLLPSEAEEVGVDGPVPVLGVHDTQPGVALQAEDGALEVVRVGSLLLPGSPMSIEHGLDLLEHSG